MANLVARVRRHLHAVGVAGVVALASSCASSPIREDAGTVRDGGPPPGVDPACADAGAWLVDDNPVAWPPPAELHLVGAVDAVDLSLDADGTFRLFVFACDAAGCSTGVWRNEGDAVVLSPREGEAGFFWPHSGEPTSVRLVPDSATTVQAQVASVDGEPQIWASGLICAACCGGLGPAGVYSCADPLPLVCSQ